MSNINVNEMVERFGRGFLFVSTTGYLFYCFNDDKDYYRFDNGGIHEGVIGDNWKKFIQSDNNNTSDLDILLPSFFFVDKDGNKTEEPVYYE